MKRGLLVLGLVTVVLSACAIGPALPLRSDMPTQGLTDLVTYRLNGPAGTEKEINTAELRGVNESSPIIQQQTIFGKLSGSRTQDTLVTLPNGTTFRALGMNKVRREGGFTSFLTLEPATYQAVDAKGRPFCGVKVRLDFNRNLLQMADPSTRDFQSLWYYDTPCTLREGVYDLDIDRASLRAIVLNEVWQFRIAAGSHFFNWGHSVTVIPGADAKSLQARWWERFDYPNTTNDAMGAAALMDRMVVSLEQSPQPWVEFSPSTFTDSYLIYSAGDADQYATLNRQFLNRQNEYVVLYRPSKSTPWDWITVVPVYNYEWNDVLQNLSQVNNWGSDPFAGRLDERGLPRDANDSVISEIERIGWMNAPNASLEQIQIRARDGDLMYAMTVRAYVGARDTLVMFGNVKPDIAQAKSAPVDDQIPMPIAYDGNGKPIVNPNYTPEQWAGIQREGSMWNYLKGDNPFGMDLFVQYRFTDNSSWRAITCRDGDGNAYTCGYEPVEWNLDSSYFFDGDVSRPWMIFQLLGEVGVRTLGLSYNSCRYCGTGMLFAMSQLVFHQEFTQGFTQESLWRFDARASQLPYTLAKAWGELLK